MTIGPLPITRMLRRSSRRGTARSGPLDHEGPEFLEQVAGIMGTGAGFGVILNPEGRDVAAGQAFDHAVVEVDMGDVGVRNGALLHRVVVVLTGDLHTVGRHPSHRMVPAVVAKGQLAGLAPEGHGHQLMAQADAEDGYLS